MAAAGAGPLVLVVEDNPEMSRFIARSFRAVPRGHRRRRRGGAAGAAALRPDLILCDLMMPELGGEQMVLEVRRRPELDATPIVFLSAKADDEVRVRLLREGAQDYLTKPFSVEELRARVGNLVAHKLAEQATRRAETKYRGIISTAADAIVSTDNQYRITEWNRAAEQMFGYSRAEAIGTSLARLLPERHHEAYRERVERLFARSVERPVADPGASRRLDHSAAVGLRRTGEEFPIGRRSRASSSRASGS